MRVRERIREKRRQGERRERAEVNKRKKEKTRIISAIWARFNMPDRAMEGLQWEGLLRAASLGSDPLPAMRAL